MHGPGRDWLPLAAVTLVGSLIRLAAVDRWPLWGDEALTVTLAQWPAHDLLLLPIDPSPGLYYVLHQWLIPEEAGAALVRAISLAAGILSIPAIYAVGRLAIDRGAGLVAAVLLAVSPPLIDYSQEARSYSLLVLLVLNSAAALLWWARELGRGKLGAVPLALFAVSTVLAFYTHFVSIFWIGPALLTVLAHIIREGTPSARRAFLIAMLLMFWAAAPELTRLFYVAKLGGGLGWLQQASPLQFLATLGEVMLPSGLWNGPYFNTPLWFSPAALLTTALLLAWRLRAHHVSIATWSECHPLAGAAIAILLVAPLLIWLFGFVATPIFMPRTILIGIPGLILLAALMHRMRDRWFAWLLGAGGALALLLIGTVREKEDWRGVATALQRGWTPGDAVLFCASWKWPAFRHSLAKPLVGPVLMLVGRREVPVVIEARAGTAANWALRYKHLTDGVRRPMRQVQLSPRRLWWVKSDCRDRELGVFRAWAGPNRWRQVSTWGQGNPRLQIDLFVSDAFEPRARRALLPPET